MDLEWDDSLWMVARLRLNGSDLFLSRVDSISKLGELVNVLKMARDCMTAPQQTARSNESAFRVPDQGGLTFRKHGEDVHVEYVHAIGYEPRSAIVPFIDLYLAWEVCSEDVRTQFLDAIPELVGHRDYGGWLRDGLAHFGRRPY